MRSLTRPEYVVPATMALSYFIVRARFETARIAVARSLFVNAPLLKLGIKMVPRDHPWRILIESARQDLCEMTEATLRPRNSETGEPQPPKRLRRVV